LGIIELKTIKILKIEKMDRWDYFTILLYLLLTAFIYFDPNRFITKEIILAYSYITPAFLYLYNYKSLRNIYVWLIWVVISIIHIWLYIELSELEKFQYQIGSAAAFLKYTWIFILLYQLLRISFLKFKKIELVAPNVGSNDIWDRRKLTRLDTLFFFIYFGLYILLGILITE